ncbi:MAG: OmpA family protein, partial [Bacteroidota bacterium]
SNRPGGAGGMDIYHFELSEKLYGEPITFLEGMVKDSLLLTGVPTTVAINGRAPVETDEDGRFFLCAGADETLDFEIFADTYRPYHNQFLIPPWDNRQFYTIDLLLKSKISFLEELENEINELENAPPDLPSERIILHSILYGFDSADLDNNEVSKLEDLLLELDNLNVLKVEIVGYADDIGAQSYNLQLSEERAKNVAVFLLSRSVSVDDIHIEGKGTVTNDKERAYNRRVDIKITVKE